MDYEKLHKYTINKLQQMVSCGKITVEIARGICADFVPESEDERIRKALIDWFSDEADDFQDIAWERIVAWLEKQGKNNMGISEATKQKLEDNLNKALEQETPESWNKFLDEQGEQKPILDVEIPFGAKDSELQGASYHIPEGFHAETKGNKVVIKQGEQKHVEEVNGEDYGIDGLYAAIDILTKTLGEVGGYQSDDGILAHKCAISAVKELSKQKPAWSEEDEDAIGMAIIALEDMYDEDEPNSTYGGYNLPFNKAAERLKSLKDRVQPKQEWSEEDESRRKKIIHILSLDGRIKNEELSDINNWLKSIRPQSQWKPSEEQLKSLKEVIDVGHFTSYPNALETLYEQLKKLREE